MQLPEALRLRAMGDDMRGLVDAEGDAGLEQRLVDALAAAPSMTATVGARAPIVIDLTGTAAAITAVQACNAAQAN